MEAETTIVELRARLHTAAEQGCRPELFCSFICGFSDSSRAQHAACQAVNGIHCGLLATVVEKGSPCRVRQLTR